MIRYCVPTHLIEDMLRTGNVIRKSEILKGIPNHYKLVKASVSGSILELIFDREDNILRDESILVKHFELGDV